ncbi:uncharacterized protein LOC143291045 [Babylonia areolata]|uniref:uncharacterized protein LOC143291045 n=1 Tax=Babylonia areolata TaxID=304850 RepID=UPI003FD320DA
MVDRSRVFAIAGFVTSGIAAASLIAAFASPYWVESNKGVSPSGFERMGLWEACFHDYYPANRPVTSRRYEGCWPAISHEMRDLYDHFYPPWMRAVQAMTTLAMLQMLACVVINIIYFIRCCQGRLEHYLVLVSAVLGFLSALFLFISVIMFGVHVNSDRNWLPQPDSIYLSWAFGFCILAAILCLVAAMCLTTDFVRLRMEGDPYDLHVEVAASRQSAHYFGPPPEYDRALKSYDRRSDRVPPSHQNSGYSPPQPDSWHDGRRSYGKHSNTVTAPHHSVPQSESETDFEENKSDHQSECNSKPETGHNENKSYSRQSTKRNTSRPNGLYSETECGEETKSDSRSATGRTASSHTGRYSDSKPRYDSDKKRYDRHVDADRPSGHSARHPLSDSLSQYEEERSKDRHTQRPSRRNTDRSESHSQHINETRSNDRYSGTSRHSRSRRSEPEETRSSGRHGDTVPSSSRRSARHSECQSGHEESNLYDRRSSTARSRTTSPARQNSRRSQSQSQSRREATRQRY